MLLLLFKEKCSNSDILSGNTEKEPEDAQDSINGSDEDEYGKNSRKTVSKLTEVQKVLEPSHIFESTQRILALFGKPEGLYSYFTLQLRWSENFNLSSNL